MRITPAFALVAAISVSSSFGVIASSGQGHGHAPARLHRRTCKVAGHKDDIASFPAPVSAPALAPASLSSPAGSGEFAAPLSSDKKMHKRKKHKGKCALKPKGQVDASQSHTNGGGAQGLSDRFPNARGGGTPRGDMPHISDAHGGAAGGSFGTGSSQTHKNNAVSTDFGSKPEGYGDEGAGYQPPSTPTAPGAQVGSNTGGSSGLHKIGGGQSQDQKGGNPPQQGNQTPLPTRGKDGVTGNDEQGAGSGTKCKGIPGSTALSNDGKIKPHWFDPGLVHHGPGTQFGGGNNFWQGGACMFDDMPHHNLSSVAMDQTFFQDGLACGTCVEIGSTSASLFSNDARWSVETPKQGTLPPGNKTFAIVSDLCPGVNQCWSGLDMHPDAWNSVTNGANGSKLPINWRFVNCKEAFETSGSGINYLQVHWRPGANAGFFQVQMRGNYEAVVRVEMKWGNKEWKQATHVDNGWWKFDDQSGAGFDAQRSMVFFRLTDWQGQTLASEVGTQLGKDLYFESNFERVESYSAQ
ncbi:uncharacterized protein MEPE_01469 [Melanopsichium pennsylvanicum]|uniref:Expansin-like EG45 domain-containing protein n=2 Tax=Melanopsichium pennsylvanicum TaxID=63383 RepID=A0AAJ4XKG6_9BASI|nr:hypothetical protein BN887_03205 [Melanopsichium pennsylvanicum 4]SNX82763.1 uncharacterized protein MEPE_01469 [Melanopsichium pennsylvanicum]